MLLRPGAGLLQMRQPTRSFFIRELRISANYIPENQFVKTRAIRGFTVSRLYAALQMEY